VRQTKNNTNYKKDIRLYSDVFTNTADSNIGLHIMCKSYRNVFTFQV